MACSDPRLINGYTVACQRCDKCVGRRVHSWCARAMMEREIMGHALVIALTYSDDTHHSRRSAAVFDYKDVQDLMRNIRRQVEYHLKRTSAVSFIAAGEQGERKGRCHWHLILFSEVDLTGIGKWGAPFGKSQPGDWRACLQPVVGSSEIITPDGAKEPWRRGWSLWPHGFVTVQRPDYGGMRYAMAYALKDQFNVLNSQGTGRQAKVETFGAGYLVMSKKPPIGARWIDAYIEKCRAGGFVPPTSALSIDGLTRPYWPHGLLKDRLLSGLATVNAEILEQTGANAAGWSTLLHENRDSADNLETLGVIGGEEIEEKPKDKDATFGLRLEDKARWAVWSAARRRYTSSARGGRQSGEADETRDSGELTSAAGQKTSSG